MRALAFAHVTKKRHVPDQSERKFLAERRINGADQIREGRYRFRISIHHHIPLRESRGLDADLSLGILIARRECEGVYINCESHGERGFSKFSKADRADGGIFRERYRPVRSIRVHNFSGLVIAPFVVGWRNASHKRKRDIRMGNVNGSVSHYSSPRFCGRVLDP